MVTLKINVLSAFDLSNANVVDKMSSPVETMEFNSISELTKFLNNQSPEFSFEGEHVYRNTIAGTFKVGIILESEGCF